MKKMPSSLASKGDVNLWVEVPKAIIGFIWLPIGSAWDWMYGPIRRKVYAKRGEERRDWKLATTQRERRMRDLGDGDAEYADDDPRKYGHYDKGTSGYTPVPGDFVDAHYGIND